MMGRITDYDSFAWCYTCDHLYTWEEYNKELDMCAMCARVVDTEEEDD
jgi:hypothetical protein